MNYISEEYFTLTEKIDFKTVKSAAGRAKTAAGKFLGKVTGQTKAKELSRGLKSDKSILKKLKTAGDKEGMKALKGGLSGESSMAKRRAQLYGIRAAQTAAGAGAVGGAAIAAKKAADSRKEKMEETKKNLGKKAA